MIPYRVKFGKKAKKSFLKLPKQIQERIAKKLKLAQPDPFRYFIRLEDRSDYKLRIGKYRALADINQRDRVIEVSKIGHRGDIYK